MANVRTPHGQPLAPDGEEPEDQLEDLAQEQIEDQAAPIDELAGQMELPLEEQLTERVHLRLTPTELHDWEAAADAHGMKLSAWIRLHLAPAAKTKSPASAPIGLKNAVTIQTRIRAMHTALIRVPDPEIRQKALLDEIRMLREPVNFLIDYFIEERGK